jgi:F-type H+-transporting ATPase subunit gamma
MANMITLKRKINSIRNTQHITRAMELVAASKKRQTQIQAVNSRDYKAVAYSLLARLNSLPETAVHPLFQHRRIKTKLYIVVTSNTGLAGAYNYNVLKLLTQCIQADQLKTINVKLITVGNRGAQFARRIRGIEQLAVYPAFGDHPTVNQLRPMLNTLLDLYRTAAVDEIALVYTAYQTNFVQTPAKLVILPAQINHSKATIKYNYNFTNYEPSIYVVLGSVTTRLIEVQIWQSMLESLASEYSMRMLAMKNATDNADSLIKDYTLEFNSVRQASITQDLAEISGGFEALSETGV